MTLAVSIAQGASNNVTFRNRIINGAMVISQRNGTTSTSVTSIGQYALDRWRVDSSQTSKLNVQQQVIASPQSCGSNQYTMNLNVGATATVGAGDYFGVNQFVEAFNTSDLGWGTSVAKPVTLSFWVYCSATGTFGGAIRTGDGSNYSYPFTYVINSANTWEQKIITVTGPTAGTWNTNNNSVGLDVWFSIGTGTTYSGTANTWSAANYVAPTGAVSLMGTANANWYITGVQLEAGTTASPFEYRQYGTELNLCQRYYSKSYAQGTVPGTNAGATNAWQGMNGTDGNQIQGPKWPVTMRTTPTTTVWSLAGTAASLSNTGEANTNINNGSWGTYATGDAGARAIVGSGGLSTGVAYLYHWAASAEL